MFDDGDDITDIVGSSLAANKCVEIFIAEIESIKSMDELNKYIAELKKDL